MSAQVFEKSIRFHEKKRPVRAELFHADGRTDGRYYFPVLMKFVLFRQIFEKKNPQKRNFMKIRPVRTELFHADGRTERHLDRHTDRQTDREDEANCFFSHFCEGSQTQ